jgi:hypothetical protein
VLSIAVLNLVDVPRLGRAIGDGRAWRLAIALVLLELRIRDRIGGR